MSRWVVDTSPLIFLAKLDRLDLLRKSADEVLVPAAVIEEVRAYPDERQGFKASPSLVAVVLRASGEDVG